MKISCRILQNILKRKERANILTKQPLVRELFDLISDKISLSIPRLVSNQGEMTSPKEIMAKVKISRKIFTV